MKSLELIGINPVARAKGIEIKKEQGLSHYPIFNQ